MAVAVCGMHYTGAAAGTVVRRAARRNRHADRRRAASLYAFGLSAVVLVLMRWHLQRASSRFRARLAQRIDAIIESAPAVEPGQDPRSHGGTGLGTGPGAGRRQRACGRFLALASMLRTRGRLN